jgi:two-component system, cell cycle sensor histidine kinase and response regulator CckA
MNNETDKKELQTQLDELQIENAKLRQELETLRASHAETADMVQEFRSLFEDTIVGIIQTSLDGKLVKANTAAARMYGVESSEAMIANVQDIGKDLYAHPENRVEVLKLLAKDGRLDSYEFQVKTVDGQVRWCSVNAVVIKDEAGIPIFVESTFIDITEQHNALIALREREERYRTLIENSIVGIIQNSIDGKVLLVNPAIVKLYGADDPKELESIDNVWNHLCKNPEDGLRIAEMLLRDGKAENYEIEAKTKYGRTIWVSANSVLILDAEGSPQFIESTMIDITARKTALDALQKSEQKYRSLFDRSFEGIYQTSLEGQYLQVNPAFAGMFGYSTPEEVINSVNDIGGQMYVSQAERERMIGILRDQGYFENIEGQARRKDGILIWILASARFILDAEGKPVGIEGSCIDITKRKTAEANLIKSEEKYSRIFHSSPFAITITNLTTGRLLEANESMVRLTGYAMEELIGQRALDLGLYQDPSVRAYIIKELKEKGSVQGVETGIVTKSGRVQSVNLCLSIIELDGEKYYMNIADDVTERNAMREQLLAIQKMDAIGQLAGGVAHEFNNLLTIVIGCAEELETSLAGNTGLQSVSREILKATRHASMLTQQLLTFSSKQVIKPQIVDLNQMVSNMYKMLARLIGKQIEIVLALDEDPCTVRSDIAQIELVIVNLVLNARDAMPGGGQITVRTGRARVVKDSGEFPYYVLPGDYIGLVISDTGTGMDKDTLDRVFEPFFTSKAEGKGVGLGLPSVYGAIKQGDGYIMLESEPGKGTDVKILLPAVQIPVEDKPPASPAKKPLGSGESILVVEDEEILCNVIRRLLESLGYNVGTHTSGSAALSEIESGLRPDLIVCDIDMPKMNGRELMERVRKIVPAQKVLFMSGFTEDEIIRTNIRQTNVAFISKPFTTAEIAGQIHSLLKQRKKNS